MESEWMVKVAAAATSGKQRCNSNSAWRRREKDHQLLLPIRVDGARVIMERQQPLPPQKGDVAIVAPASMHNCFTGNPGYHLVIPNYTEYVIWLY